MTRYWNGLVEPWLKQQRDGDVACLRCIIFRSAASWCNVVCSHAIVSWNRIEFDNSIVYYKFQTKCSLIVEPLLLSVVTGQFTLPFLNLLCPRIGCNTEKQVSNKFEWANISRIQAHPWKFSRRFSIDVFCKQSKFRDMAFTVSCYHSTQYKSIMVYRDFFPVIKRPCKHKFTVLFIRTNIINQFMI